MKFYLDEHFSPAIARALRSRGLDVTSTVEDGLQGSNDSVLLDHAASDGRCFVTQDRIDFAKLSAAYDAAGRQHLGILLLPGSMRTNQIGPIVQAIMQYADTHPDGIEANTVDYLSR